MALPKNINRVNLRNTYKMPVIPQENPLEWHNHEGLVRAVVSQGFTFDSFDGPYRKYTADQIPALLAALEVLKSGL